MDGQIAVCSKITSCSNHRSFEKSLNSSIAHKTITNWQYLNKICAVCGSPAKAKHFGLTSCFA